MRNNCTLQAPAPQSLPLKVGVRIVPQKQPCTYASVLAKEHPELRIHAFRPGKVHTPMQAEIRATTAEDFPGVGHFVEEFESGNLVLPETVAASLLHVIERKDEIPVIFSTSNYTV